MRLSLGQYMWKKRYHILFTTQGFTLIGIYAHRFGYLDEYVKFLELEEEPQVPPTLPVQRPAVGRDPIWKKAMELPNKKENAGAPSEA